MTKNVKATATKKAVKTLTPSKDHHGFIVSTRKGDGYTIAFGLTDARANEIAGLLDNWAPKGKGKITDVLNNITTLPTENERLFASFIYSQGVAMAGMLNGLGGDSSTDDSSDDLGLGGEDSSDISDSLGDNN